MNDAGIDGRAAEADDQKGRERQIVRLDRQQQRGDAAGEYARAQPDHAAVAELFREKAA